MNNAIKFRKREEPSVFSISHNPLAYLEKDILHLPVDENYFKIVIQGNGIGFEKECADRIFQIFKRLHGKSEYPDSGVGLAGCKDIAEHQTGIIYAESVPEFGATLPLFYLKDKHQRKHEFS